MINPNLPTASDPNGNVNNNIIIPSGSGGSGSNPSDFMLNASTGLIVRSSKDPKNTTKEPEVFSDICYARMKLN